MVRGVSADRKRNLTMAAMPPLNDGMLLASNIAKTYPNGTEAIRNITFSIATGELVCIVGPSGAGKTTLLRCMSGLLKPSGGQILMAGKAITGPPLAMAVVFQEYARSLFPWFTVRQNVELPLREKRLPAAR